MKMAKLAAPRMTPKRLHRIPAVIITNITAICVRVVQASSISMVIRHGKSMACICSYPSIFMRTRIHPGPVSLISRTLDAWSIPSHWGHLRPNPRRIPSVVCLPRRIRSYSPILRSFIPREDSMA